MSNTTGGMSLTRRKLVVSETKVLDAAKGMVRAIVSTEAIDRDQDIIRVAGWQLENFLLHPVLLSSHNYGSLRSVIGEWDSMAVMHRPERLEGVARYYIGEGNEEADWAFNLTEKGRAAYSVGFKPDMEKAVEREGGGMFGSFEFKGQELLEVSQVSIPSNPEALQSLKGLMESSRNADPDFLLLVRDALDGMTSPSSQVVASQVTLPMHVPGIIRNAFRKAYLEVYPW